MGPDNPATELIDNMIHQVLLACRSSLRVLVANAPNTERFIGEFIVRWLQEHSANIILIRLNHEQASWYSAHWRERDDWKQRVRLLSYTEAKQWVGRPMLREVGIVILIEDVVRLVKPIETIMEKMRTSGAGDMPTVCISSIETPPQQRSLSRQFRAIVDGHNLAPSQAGNKTRADIRSSAPEGKLSDEPSPYYRTFSAASAAARLLHLREKTPAEYKERREENPRLPPDPSAVYRDFKKRGGWTAYLTGHKAEVDE